MHLRKQVSRGTSTGANTPIDDHDAVTNQTLR
jgi:hypothetical protein